MYYGGLAVRTNLHDSATIVSDISLTSLGVVVAHVSPWVSSLRQFDLVCGTTCLRLCPPRRALDRCRGRSLAKTLERSIDSEMPWAWECARNQRCSSAIMLADARAPVLAPSGAPLAVRQSGLGSPGLMKPQTSCATN